VTAIGFHVVGTPAPQGSKRHVGNGVMVESSKKVKPWRQDVVAAALLHRPAVPLDGPLFAYMVFTLPKPKSAVKSRTAPDRTPDLSKLLRSTEDALTTAGLWADDARVVEYLRAAKVWWGHDSDALPVPGALIAVGTDYGHVMAFADEAIKAALLALKADQ
jgi:Holliday junction resolvase RusA-like endonuclease